MALVCAAARHGAYTYDYRLYSDPGLYTDAPTNSTALTVNGTPPNGSFSKIYHGAMNFANPNDYEVVTWLGWKFAGGRVIQFLRASSDTVTSGTGSYVSVELDVTNWSNGGSVNPLLIKQCINGIVTQLGSVTIATGYVPTDSFAYVAIRSMIFGSTLRVYTGNTLLGTWTVTPSAGKPGFGAVGYVSDIDLWPQFMIGHHDTIAPGTISSNIVKSAYSSSISFKWQPVTDDANGTGVVRYEISRDGVMMGSTDPSTTVSPTRRHTRVRSTRTGSTPWTGMGTSAQ